MKIGIIGAGAAGLVTLKYVLEQGHEGVIFEQTNHIGGTWNYTDKTITDDYGLPVHSSMYQGLKTNLPKELMEYADFPYEEKPNSFITQPEVLNYMEKYCVHFNLRPHIKFLCHVLKITPPLTCTAKKWEIKYKSLESNDLHICNDFDVIIICVGNYSVPAFSNIPGSIDIESQSSHSHYFRKADPYKGKKVLIIGAGPSGADISRIISTVADKVYLSYGKKFGRISEAVISKPWVKSFEKNKAIFTDGTEVAIDNVIYCTGYKYSYPFLAPECGITVENKWVKYVYKHVVNVKYPTMAFIGIPTTVCPFPLFDMQIRFYLEFLKQNIPTKEQMITEILADCKLREEELQWPAHYRHKMTSILHARYLNDLADSVSIKRVRPVIHKLYDAIKMNYESNQKLKNYKIVNDEEFLEFN